MLIRTSRILFEIVAATLAGLILIVAIGAWRLSQGPVSLGFLRSYVDETLTEMEGPFKIELEDVILKWAGWDRALDIIVVGARVRDGNNTVIAAAPEVSVSLGVAAMLRGEIAPTNLELIRPALNLVRTRDGRFQLGMGQDQKPSDQALPLVARSLLAPIDPATPIGRLRRISIIGGRLTVDDRASGIKWGAPHADIRLSREAEGLDINFDLDVELDGQRPSVRGSATFRPATGRTDIEVRVRGLRPDMVAAAVPTLKPLAGVKLPVGGTITVRLSSGGALEEARFDLEGGKGILDLPHSHLKRIAVDSVGALGAIEAGGARLVVDRLTVDLGGPVIEVRAAVNREGETATVEGEATVRRMPLSRLARYWPPEMASGGRRWIFANVRDGTVTEARAKIAGSFRDRKTPEVTLSQFSATAELRGFTIHFLRPLYPARKMDATAVIGPGRIDVAFRSGDLKGLTLREGSVAMTELDKKVPRGVVEVVLAGAIRDALKVLDHPKLGYAARIGFDASTAGGETAVRLVVRLPLTKSVKMADVDLKAAANLSGGAAPRAILGRDLSEGEFTLQLDREGISVKGKARLDGVPCDIAWYENFVDGAPFVRRYEVKSVLDNTALGRFGIDLADILDGPVAANLVFVEKASGERTLTAKLDLARAALAVPRLGWSKTPGQPGRATFEVALRDGRIAAVPTFEVSSGGLEAQGSARLEDDGKTLRSVHLARFAVGDRTDIEATARRIEDGTYVVSLSGASLDIDPLMKSGDDDRGGDGPPPFKLHAKLDRLWIAPDKAIETIESVIHFDGETWRRVSLDGLIAENRQFVAHYRNQGGKRRIEIKAADAGKLLDRLGVFENMRDGRLALTGERAAAGDEAPWKGRLSINDFKIVKAPIIARLLSLASLTGISDLMSGKGIRFRSLDMPFTLKSRLLRLTDARAVGSEIGVTASGDIDLGAERVHLEGTLVPAYTINSLLGAVPVLGRLLTGEKGGGVFAATYEIEGPFEQAEISVNPLAALTPGFLRNLLRGIGRNSSPAPDGPLPDD